MSSNYQPAARERFGEAFTPLEPRFDYRLDCYSGCEVPILLADPRYPDLVPLKAIFGVLPHWAKGNTLARSTYNARIETVADLASFKFAWKRRQLCLVPVQQFYEPNWETGTGMRFGIRRRDSEPFALAGIWETRSVAGQTQRSFSLLTINATDHPVMKYFQRPDEEKRSVVIIEPEDYYAWLGARDEEEIQALLRPIDPEVVIAEPQPRPWRSTDEPAVEAGRHRRCRSPERTPFDGDGGRGEPRERAHRPRGQVPHARGPALVRRPGPASGPPRWRPRGRPCGTAWRGSVHGSAP